MDQNKIAELAQFSKEHPGADVTPLLEEQLKPGPSRWRVYTVSVLFPPFGLYYTIKYLFFDNDTAEKQRLGWVALALTIIMSILVLALFAVSASVLERTTPNLPANPTDILKEYKDIVQ